MHDPWLSCSRSFLLVLANTPRLSLSKWQLNWKEKFNNWTANCDANVRWTTEVRMVFDLKRPKFKSIESVQCCASLSLICWFSTFKNHRQHIPDFPWVRLSLPDYPDCRSMVSALNCKAPGIVGIVHLSGLFVLGNLCVTSAKDVWGKSDMEAFLLEYHTMGTWPDPVVPDLLHLSGKLQGAFKDFASW